jgi:hypothetical protein
MLKQFDVIQILTTKRVRFVSGPPGHATNPHGSWSVVGFMGQDVLIAKDSTIVRVPVGDVRKIANYDMGGIKRQLEQAGFSKRAYINMPDYLSKELNMDISKARKLLLDYNYQLNVGSEEERNKITQKVKEICQKRNLA